MQGHQSAMAAVAAMFILFIIVIGLNPASGTSSSILNCLLAQQLCADDASCTSMMTVIRHVCGPETVACSTTTVTKCQAGLRTLQAFPVFHPTCLCREPAVDPDCNGFRDLLFDHPCMVANQRERDAYPIHTLPTCTHALEVCIKDPSCLRLYGDFREHCKLRDGQCRDKETCHNAWRGLRMTPLFGCFCPSSQHKKCERLYAFIYNNTCVGSNVGGLISVDSESLMLLLLMHDDNVSSPFISSLYNPVGVAHKNRNRPARSSPTIVMRRSRSNRTPLSAAQHSRTGTLNSLSGTIHHHHHRTRRDDAKRISKIDDDQEEEIEEEPTERVYSSGRWQWSLKRQQLADGQRIQSRLMISPGDQPWTNGGINGSTTGIDVARLSHFVDSALTHTRIASSLSGSSASNTNHSSDESTENSPSSSGGGRTVSIYQSTCHRALAQCQADGQCRKHLDPFMRYCNGGWTSTSSSSIASMAASTGTCHRDLCMQALQGFYKDAPLQWSLEVAFCVCKKSENRNDECLLAQERLHPDCARRPERYPLPPAAAAPASQQPQQHQQQSSATGSAGSSHKNNRNSNTPAITTVSSNEASPIHLQTPTCHHLADECRAHPDCKPRLEFYVQACAVDMVTKGCAGPPSVCRRAVLDILGTDLRTTCTCPVHQPDLAAMYDCLEWQRLLWLNPCVVEAQRDFHKIQGNLKIVTVTTDGDQSAVSGTTQTSSTYNQHHQSPHSQQTATSVSTSSSTTFTRLRPPPPPPPSAERETSIATPPWSTAGIYTTEGVIATRRPTVPAKMCSLERPNKSIVHFAEGTTKRLYHDDDPDCSELCRCSVGQVVTCSIADCAQRKSCQTTVAVYAHAATAFQAYRGECLCFSGAFVCAKPEPGFYSLPSGVFLFLGYSRADEKAIYQFTNTNASKFLLQGLQRLVYGAASENSAESECRISVHDQLEENIILQIRLSALDFQRANESITLEMLTQEKVQCVVVANRLRRMVNKRLPEIHEDEILSVVKVAEVVTVLPEPRRSSADRPVRLSFTLFCTILFTLWLTINTQHR